MVILASQSPRRKEILGKVLKNFVIRVTDCDETVAEGTSPDEAVKMLSSRKAHAAEHTDEDFVIGADTVVAVDGKIFGKPRDEKDAFDMLSALSARTHTVCTGITVLHGGREVSHCEVAYVTFRALSEEQIWAYIKSGEPMDKAGAYGAQGIGAALVSGIRGDFFSVMGLPLCSLCKIFEEEFCINLISVENLK